VIVVFEMRIIGHRFYLLQIKEFIDLKLITHHLPHHDNDTHIVWKNVWNANT
jgi:hypothetical protein